MQSLEKLYYESLPYVYAIIAVIGLSYHQTSKIPVVAAFMLGFCSYYVFKMRYEYRQGRARLR